MYVEFTATFDDMVDVSLRSLDRSHAAYRWRGLGGIVPGGVLALLLVFFVPAPSEWQLAAGLAVVLTCMAIHWAFYPYTLKDRVRRFLRKQLRSDRPFLVQVEVNPEGFQVRQMGTTVTHDWAEIEGIEERDDSLDVFTRHGGLIAVRKRAFVSEAELDEFVELIERHLDGRPVYRNAREERIRPEKRFRR